MDAVIAGDIARGGTHPWAHRSGPHWHPRPLSTHHYDTAHQLRSRTLLMSTARRLALFSRRTLALVVGSTLGLAGGGYVYLNSGPAYPVSTREMRRPPPHWVPPSREAMLDALGRSGEGGRGKVGGQGQGQGSGLEGGEEFDLLIVGGGATGAGVAVDAASRGLRVALVERSDFSSGASLSSAHEHVAN